MERLQKIISNSGYTSRRKAEELIKSGKVKVNGIIVTELGTKVNKTDAIEINGTVLKVEEDKVYYLLNKPSGIISSSHDNLGRKTVVDLIDTNKRIYPIGRLDYDTTGLILLTNDGELANILMHPSYGVEKKYVARLDKYFEICDLKKLEKGIIIDGRISVPLKVKVKKNDKVKNYSVIEITIHEGRNHIIKNLFSELGYNVLKLNRLEYAFLNLENLRVGEYRRLTIKEVKKLYEYKRKNTNRKVR